MNRKGCDETDANYLRRVGVPADQSRDLVALFVLFAFALLATLL